mgnify:CR=1 FL=1
MAKRLEGQVAVVTGASRGLGRACAIELAREGASVVVNYFTSPEPAREVVAEIEKLGSKAVAVGGNVGKPEDAKEVIEEAIANYGKIDILINNAGINKDKTLKRLTVEDWDDVITTDLSSAFYCTSAAIPHMVEKNYGRIIVMSSIIGQMGNLGQSNYAAAKAGLIAFAKSAAKELARRARASENLAYIVSANTAGVPGTGLPSRSSTGMSKIVDFDGQIMAEAVPGGASIGAHAVVDVAAVRARRQHPGLSNTLSRLPVQAFAASYAGITGRASNELRSARDASRTQLQDLQTATIERLRRLRAI